MIPNDPIVQEVRKWRDQCAERFNYDLDAICRYLKEEQEKSGRRAVTLPHKPVQDRLAPTSYP